MPAANRHAPTRASNARAASAVKHSLHRCPVLSRKTGLTLASTWLGIRWKWFTVFYFLDQLGVKVYCGVFRRFSWYSGKLPSKLTAPPKDLRKIKK
jgi:hypothetical protein